jgi:hypothetical protein
MTDDAEGLTLLQVERDVIENPELLRGQGPLAIAADSTLHERRNQVPKRVMSLTAPEALEDMV